jgi:hypothetical protein
MNNDSGFFNYENLNNYILKSTTTRQNSFKRNDKINNLVSSELEFRNENINYGNFTKDFYKERYEIPSKIPTPSNFNFVENESRGEYALGLIRKKIEREQIKLKFLSLNYFSWIRAYNKLTESVKIDVNLLIDGKNFNVNDCLSKFFLDYTFANSEIIVCEVIDIKFLDCIQIIECKVI